MRYTQILQHGMNSYGAAGIRNLRSSLAPSFAAVLALPLPQAQEAAFHSYWESLQHLHHGSDSGEQTDKMYDCMAKICNNKNTILALVPQLPSL